MTFEKHKKDFLKKPDFSKKGRIDKDIRPLVKLINSLEDYYTTSSCSGRIDLFVKRKKNLSKWLFVSHDKVGLKKVKTALKKLPKDDVWFMMEPPIFHICSRDIESAQKMINIMKSVGLKRGGIISTKRKIISEIIGTEKIEAIIAEKGKLIVNDDYLKALVIAANKKLTISRNKLKKLYKKIDFIF